VTEPRLAAVSDVGPADQDLPESPINWLTLGPEEARSAFHDLNHWVNFVRTTYGLAPTVIPPLWHRHDELIWELSALHQHWLNAYHRDAPLSAPAHWHHDFSLARERLREWVATSGTRLDRDRPTRVAAWPGEPPVSSPGEVAITDRDEDFRDFLQEDFVQRQSAGP
jgi:hypothetical protein